MYFENTFKSKCLCPKSKNRNLHSMNVKKQQHCSSITEHFHFLFLLYNHIGVVTLLQEIKCHSLLLEKRCRSNGKDCCLQECEPSPCSAWLKDLTNSILSVTLSQSIRRSTGLHMKTNKNKIAFSGNFCVHKTLWKTLKCDKKFVCHLTCNGSLIIALQSMKQHKKGT